MDTQAATQAAQKRLADYIARSAGQHQRAIREAFAAARAALGAA